MRAAWGVMSARMPELTAAHLIGELEGLQIQVTAGAGEQRLQVLDEGRNDQLVAPGHGTDRGGPDAGSSMRTASSGRQLVDTLGQQPAFVFHRNQINSPDTTAARRRPCWSSPAIRRTRSSRRLIISYTALARPRIQKGQYALDHQQQRQRREQVLPTHDRPGSQKSRDIVPGWKQCGRPDTRNLPEFRLGRSPQSTAGTDPRNGIAYHLRRRS